MPESFSPFFLFLIKLAHKFDDSTFITYDILKYRSCSIILLCILYPYQQEVMVFHFVHLSQSVGSVQSLVHVWLFVTPWTAAHQTSLSITNSWSLLRLMSTELVMPSNHLILCHLLLLLLSIFPSIRVFS